MCNTYWDKGTSDSCEYSSSSSNFEQVNVYIIDGDSLAKLVSSNYCNRVCLVCYTQTVANQLPISKIECVDGFLLVELVEMSLEV